MKPTFMGIMLVLFVYLLIGLGVLLVKNPSLVAEVLLWPKVFFQDAPTITISSGLPGLSSPGHYALAA